MTIDRRSFLKASAALAGVGIGVGAAGCARHPGAPAIEPGTNPFPYGVASGDPQADRVILWTRVSPRVDRLGEPIETAWWVARDPLGLEVLKGGTVEALPERDFTIKLDPDGLEPGTDYYYGFLTHTGLSPVGRTRTLPASGADHVRMGVVSCSNYPQGFFNAYAVIAERDDLDVVLHLGDYLYEYGEGEYGAGAKLGRIPDPEHEIVSLEDYRRRHAIYKSDPDLQAAHARHPWITVWDDHESTNDSWKDGAQNHDPGEGDWEQRKLAAIRAYYEWMPVRELPTQLFRQFRFGDLVDLVMLDTRLRGRDARGRQDDHETARDPSRSLLGAEQTGWFLDALSESKSAATTWRVVGQQVVFSPTTDGVEDFNPDAWDGYRANRRQILDHLSQNQIDNVVFLTGDVHSAWAFDVPPPLDSGEVYDAETGRGSRAVEFVSPAVSSPPLASSPRAAEFFAGIQKIAPHLEYVNLEENGFVILDLDRERARGEFVFTEDVARRSSGHRCGPVFETRAGANHLLRVDRGACEP